MRRIPLAALCVLSLAPPALAQTAPAPKTAPPTPILAQTCFLCHGQNGAGQGRTKALAGKGREDIIRTMAAFRANEQPNTIMGRIARGFTDDEIVVLADYFSSRK